MEYCLLFDVGGTNIKASIATFDGKIVNDKILSFDSKSKASKEEIFKNFIDISSQLLDLVEGNKKISAVSMAFPGPFDYENGISFIKGLNKYESIYNQNIKNAYINALKNSSIYKLFSENLKFCFSNDVEAFALGTVNNLCINNKAFHLCIGTGAGSAFTQAKKIIKSVPNVPENGWIYNMPFKETIIDDYISARGLEKLSESVFGHIYTGAELYARANNNDERAISVFKLFGSDLKESISPILEDFKADSFVLAGQISKSLCFFGKEIKDYCQNNNIELIENLNTSKQIMYGLYMQIKEC